MLQKVENTELIESGKWIQFVAQQQPNYELEMASATLERQGRQVIDCVST